MANFSLTPQYDLFVTAKTMFIHEVLIPLAEEPIDSLKEKQFMEIRDLFDAAFCYPETPYGSQRAAHEVSYEDCQVYNARYAIGRIEALIAAAEWSNQQEHAVYGMLRGLKREFEKRLDPSKVQNTVTSYHGARSTMEKIWQFLQTAPEELLRIMDSLSFHVPLSPGVWRMMNGGSTAMQLLHGLYQDGFVWPGSPICFTPSIMIDARVHQRMEITPGRVVVVDTDIAYGERHVVVERTMRELYGHYVDSVMKLDWTADKFNRALEQTIVNRYQGFDNLPDRHPLRYLRNLLNDFRSVGHRTSTSMAGSYTVVSLLLFMDATRHYGFFEADQSEIPADELELLEYFISLAPGLFINIEADFPIYRHN